MAALLAAPRGFTTSNLMQIEKTYAANARLISTVDEMMDTLLR